MENVYRRGPENAPRKLTLDDQGLRYEIGSQSYSLTWQGFHHRIERKGRDGKVNTVLLVTRDGKWFALAAFGDMPGIAAIVRTHVPAEGPREVWERLQFHPWFIPISLGMGLLGMLLLSQKGGVLDLPQAQRIAIGCVLLIPAAFSILYVLPRNPLLKLSRAAQQQRSGSPIRRFFINFAVWITIVLVVLFVLNFVMPRLQR